MGWCSATTIFDSVAKFVLSTDRPDQEKEAVLSTLAGALEEEDWDCQNDSDYADHPIVRRIFQEMHPNWDWDET